MKEFDPVAYKKMVKSYQDKDKPTDWFDSIYTDAQGDHRAVFRGGPGCLNSHSCFISGLHLH